MKTKWFTKPPLGLDVNGERGDPKFESRFKQQLSDTYGMVH